MIDSMSRGDVIGSAWRAEVGAHRAHGVLPVCPDSSHLRSRRITCNGLDTGDERFSGRRSLRNETRKLGPSWAPTSSVHDHMALSPNTLFL